MVGIIIIAHEQFAESLYKTAEAIIGKRDYVKTIAIESKDVDRQEEISTIAARLLARVDELVWLVDIFGGTPFRYASTCVMNDPRQSLVTGVNLPMVLQALANQKQTAQEITEQLEQETKATIRKM